MILSNLPNKSFGIRSNIMFICSAAIQHDGLIPSWIVAILCVGGLLIVVVLYLNVFIVCFSLCTQKDHTIYVSENVIQGPVGLVRASQRSLVDVDDSRMK